MQSNTSFSGGIQFAWDSTSLTLFKTCPRKYQLSMRQQWASKRKKVDLDWGIFIHSGVEFYHKMRAEGKSHILALLATVKYIMCLTGSHKYVSVCLDCQEVLSEDMIALHIEQDTSYICENCSSLNVDLVSCWIPWPSDEPKKTRETAIRALVWYLDAHEHDNLKTVTLQNGKAAVEMSFRYPLDMYTPNGTQYLLCGHLDRVADLNGLVYIVDIKTTKSTLSSYFFQQFSPNNQMSFYSVAAKVVYGDYVHGVIVDGIQAAVGFNRFGRSIAHRSPGLQEEWLTQAMGWIKQAEEMAIEFGDDPWPMNDTIGCHQYGRCPFLDICNKAPEVRERFLQSNYTKKLWDPMKSRET